MAISPAERPKPRPGAPRRVPADRRRSGGRPPGWTVGDTKPADEGNVPRSVLRAIARGTPIGTIIGILTPSTLGDGTLSDEERRAAEEEIDRWQQDNAETPLEVPPPEDFRVLDNGSGVELYPPDFDDPYVPIRVPWEFPQVDIPTTPDIPVEPVAPPDVLPSPRPVPSPRPAPRTPASPTPRTTPLEPVAPQVRPAPEQELQVEFWPDGKLRIRTRYSRARMNRRRRDTKLRRWYLVALQVINHTWGTVDEAMQLAEAIAWNTYDENGRLAMAIEGNQLHVFQGIGRGEYDVDLPSAIMDYAVSQTMDAAIGRASRHGMHAGREHGLHHGPWDNPPRGLDEALTNEEEEL